MPVATVEKPATPLVALRRIVADRNLNLHSKSTKGGLVHLSARVAKLVPEDVADHFFFQRLVESGTVTLLGPRKIAGKSQAKTPEELEQELVDKDEDEDNAKSSGHVQTADEAGAKK